MKHYIVGTFFLAILPSPTKNYLGQSPGQTEEEWGSSRYKRTKIRLNECLEYVNKHQLAFRVPFK